MLSEITKLMIETKLEEIIDSIMKPYCCEKQKHRIKKNYRIEIDMNNDIVIDTLKDPKLKYYNVKNILKSVYIMLFYEDENCYIAFDNNENREVVNIFKTNIHCRALYHFTNYKFYKIFQKYGVNNNYVIKFK